LITFSIALFAMPAPPPPPPSPPAPPLSRPSPPWPPLPPAPVMLPLIADSPRVMVPALLKIAPPAPP
jgi:hypothetical protein